MSVFQLTGAGKLRHPFSINDSNRALACTDTNPSGIFVMSWPLAVDAAWLQELVSESLYPFKTVSHVTKYRSLLDQT